MKAVLKILSSLTKVFLDEEPAARPGEPMPSGFQNETISFQAAYRLAADASAAHPIFVRAEIRSPLQKNIRVRRVCHVPVGLCTFPDADDNYLRKSPGLFPDLLRDLEGTRLRAFADQWQSLWIDVEPDGQTAPGVYSVTLILSDEAGAELARAQTPVEILPGALPPQRLRHTKWLHCDCLCQYYGVEMWSERFWRIAENFIALAVKRGINMMLTPIHTPPLDTGVGGERMTCQLVDVKLREGRYEFGFDRLRRWVEMCRRCGVEYFEMAHLFTQWGARCAPKIVAEVDGAERRIFGWDVSAQSAAYKAYLDAFLPALTGELRRLGIAERCYFHISDEPGAEDLADYAAAKALAAPHLAGFTIIDALSDFSFYQRGVVAKPIPANDHIQPFLDAGVPNLWTYYCVGQYKDVSNLFIAQPSQRNRVFGAQLYKFRIEGILQWGYNFYNSQNSLYAVDPFATTDGDGFVPGGDPFQVYPGADGRPLESMRLMVTQQALCDLRAFEWLEELAGREKVLALIEEGLDGPLTFSRYPHADAYLLNLRHQVNREIVARAR